MGVDGRVHRVDAPGAFARLLVHLHLLEAVPHNAGVPEGQVQQLVPLVVKVLPRLHEELKLLRPAVQEPGGLLYLQQRRPQLLQVLEKAVGVVGVGPQPQEGQVILGQGVPQGSEDKAVVIFEVLDASGGQQEAVMGPHVVGGQVLMCSSSRPRGMKLTLQP